MFQNDDFVEVYSKTTDDKQIVPRSWLGHPVLGADFEVVPSVRALGAKSDTVAAIVEAVGQDRAKAAAALEVEQASDKPRSTLIDSLQAVLDASSPDSPDQPGTSETPTPADGQ